MDFERAAKLRDEVAALSHVRDRQRATMASEDSFDAFGAYAEGESAVGAGLRRARRPDSGPRLVPARQLRRVAGRGRRPAVRSPVLRHRRRPPRGPRPVRRPARRARDALRPPLGAAGHAGGGAPPAARRQAARAGDGGKERRRWASSTSRRSRRRGATGSPRPSTGCGRSSRCPRCPCGSSATTSRTPWAPTPWPRWSSSRAAVLRRTSTGGSRSGPSRAPTTRRAWPRSSGAASSGCGRATRSSCRRRT